jgi:hypothetical protein
MRPDVRTPDRREGADANTDVGQSTGSVKEKRLPPPGELSAQTFPRCALTMPLTMKRPSPVAPGCAPCA